MSWQHHLKTWSEQIKAYARSLGFDDCGIAKVVPLDQEARQLEQWLRKGYHGTMEYMARHFELRIHPERLMPGARSAIVLTHSYYRPRARLNPLGPKIARYAHGQDYHIVLKRKLEQLLAYIRRLVGQEVQGRPCVDSAPIMERAWARRAGLGWQGKNTLLITRKQGSFIFLAVLLVDIPLEYDRPFETDFCGRCQRCIEACPTGALVAPGLLDARRCISYLTIEYRGEQLPEGIQPWKDWIFGCDICQEVCPWNRFAQPTNEPAFYPLEVLERWTWVQWQLLRSGAFKRNFKLSPLRRAGLRGLRRNLRWVGYPPITAAQEMRAA